MSILKNLFTKQQPKKITLYPLEYMRTLKKYGFEKGTNNIWTNGNVYITVHPRTEYIIVNQYNKNKYISAYWKTGRDGSFESIILSLTIMES
jgi:hypothetical protein